MKEYSESYKYYELWTTLTGNEKVDVKRLTTTQEKYLTKLTQYAEVRNARKNRSIYRNEKYDREQTFSVPSYDKYADIAEYYERFFEHGKRLTYPDYPSRHSNHFKKNYQRYNAIIADLWDEDKYKSDNLFILDLYFKSYDTAFDLEERKIWAYFYQFVIFKQIDFVLTRRTNKNYHVCCKCSYYEFANAYLNEYEEKYTCQQRYFTSAFIEYCKETYNYNPTKKIDDLLRYDGHKDCFTSKDYEKILNEKYIPRLDVKSTELLYSKGIPDKLIEAIDRINKLRKKK